MTAGSQARQTAAFVFPARFYDFVHAAARRAPIHKTIRISPRGKKDRRVDKNITYLYTVVTVIIIIYFFSPRKTKEPTPNWMI